MLASAHSHTHTHAHVRLQMSHHNRKWPGSFCTARSSPLGFSPGATSLLLHAEGVLTWRKKKGPCSLEACGGVRRRNRPRSMGNTPFNESYSQAAEGGGGRVLGAGGDTSRPRRGRCCRADSERRCIIAAQLAFCYK